MKSYPTTLDHFSHPHSLNLIHTGQQGAEPALCSACETWTSGWTYKCSRRCSFFIDASCSSLPRVITHPSHFKPHHQLHLLSTPAHSAGYFRCDGCGNHGNGFSYRCTTPGCDFDLHIICASKPLLASHCSLGHQLTLTFSPPYGTFNCNVCGTAGSNHWLYHCGLCNFSCHLGCVEAAGYSSVHQSPSWSYQPMQQGFMVPVGVGATPQGTGGMNPSQPVAVSSVHQFPSWSHQPMQQGFMVPVGVGAIPQGTGGMNPSQPVAVLSVHQSPSWSHQPMQQGFMVPVGVGATPQGTGGMNPSQPVAVAPTFWNGMGSAAAQGAAQGVTQQTAQMFVQSLAGDSGSKPDTGGGGGGGSGTSNDAATSHDSFSFFDLS